MTTIDDRVDVGRVAGHHPRHDARASRRRRAAPESRSAASRIARIDEFRADVGVARAPLLPSVTLNGSREHAIRSRSARSRRRRIAPRVSPAISRGSSTSGDAFAAASRRRTRISARRKRRERADRAVARERRRDGLSAAARARSGARDRRADVELAARRRSRSRAQRFAQGLTSELDVRQFEAQVAAPAVTLAQAERATRADGAQPRTCCSAKARRRSRAAASLADAVRGARRFPIRFPRRCSRGGRTCSRRSATTRRRWRASASPTRRACRRSASSDRTAARPACRTNVFGSTDARLSGARRDFVSAVRQRAARERVRGGARARRAGAGVVRGRRRSTRCARRTTRSSACDRARRSRSRRRRRRTRCGRRSISHESRYEAGLSTYLDLLDAQRSLFSAELALSQAQLGELTAAVQLYKALGGTWNTR